GPLGRVAERFEQIVRELGVALDLRAELDGIRTRLHRVASQDPALAADFAASRGEYLSGRVLAALTGFEFVDAADVVRFDSRGWDAGATREAMRRRLERVERAVVPGFYGAGADGRVRVLPRGGSDL